jgi:hypothetical protein
VRANACVRVHACVHRPSTRAARATRLFSCQSETGSRSVTRLPTGTHARTYTQTHTHPHAHAQTHTHRLCSMLGSADLQSAIVPNSTRSDRFVWALTWEQVDPSALAHTRTPDDACAYTRTESHVHNARELTRSRAHTRTYTRTQKRACTHTGACDIRALKQARTHVHIIHTRACRHAYSHTHTHTFIHTHKTHFHTHTHTYTHTDTRMHAH